MLLWYLEFLIAWETSLGPLVSISPILAAGLLWKGAVASDVTGQNFSPPYLKHLLTLFLPVLMSF